MDDGRLFVYDLGSVGHEEECDISREALGTTRGLREGREVAMLGEELRAARTIHLDCEHGGHGVVSADLQWCVCVLCEWI